MHRTERQGIIHKETWTAHSRTEQICSTGPNVRIEDSPTPSLPRVRGRMQLTVVKVDSLFFNKKASLSREALCMRHRVDLTVPITIKAKRMLTISANGTFSLISCYEGT